MATVIQVCSDVLCQFYKSQRKAVKNSNPQGFRLQRGRSHRLYSTRLWPVASIADIDSDSRPTWYYDSAAQKISFSAADGGDASLNTYCTPGGSSGVLGGASATDISIQGIESWYGDTGFNFNNCGSYEAVDCLAFGARDNGIAGDMSTGVEIRCESAANGNDGSNAHHQTTTLEDTTRNAVFLKIDAWCHDNYDDGDSLHERCQGTYLGGLFEYNGNRGIATAFGAHVTVRSAYSRKNGQNSRGVGITGEGFGVIGVTDGGEGGNGTQMECYDCISESDNYGFAAHSFGNIVRAFNCKTIDALIAAYSASEGDVYLQDCRDSGSATVKLEALGGTITVNNGVAVAW